MNENATVIRVKKNMEIFMVALILLLLNLGLKSYFESFSVEGDTLVQRTVRDLITLVIAMVAGRYLTKKLDLPLWWRRIESISLRKQIFNLTVIGLILSVTTYLSNYFFSGTIEGSWVSYSINEKEILLISLRAGIQEEILFRLFTFSFITFLLNKKMDSKKSMIIGALMSSVLFGLMHYPNFSYPFFIGLIFVYLYCYNGLAPVIIMHIFINLFHLSLYRLL